jgi:RimJ/RimL family protein N-acetyltransferase
VPERDDLALRPLRESDLVSFEEHRETAREQDPYNFFGFRPAGGTGRRFAEDGWLSQDSGMLMVTLGGEVIGDVGRHAEHYGPPGAGRCYSIGVMLLPEHRGPGYGSRAQRLLTDHLFDTYPINRVEAATDVTNTAERRSLEQADFGCEGVLRSIQWRAGEWHDLAMYSRLRADP